VGRSSLKATICTHIEYQLNGGIDLKEIVDFLNQNNGIAILITSVSTLISAIAVVIALYFNVLTRNQHKKSLEPQLSMRGETYKSMLYLLIQNTGRTAAENIKIDVKSIENNGSNVLLLDDLFSQTYDLYPNEKIQAMVAISEENIVTGNLYPMITANVSYYIYGTKTKIQHSRTVTFSKQYDIKIFADVNVDLKDVESSLKATARSAVRTANYLDGNQVTVFDELNILAGKSLKNDMYSAIESTKKEIIKDRTATIDECMSKMHESK